MKWKPYDTDDRETWPDEAGVYAVAFDTTGANHCGWTKLNWYKAAWWLDGALDPTPDSMDGRITHYIKITPPEA